MNHIQKWKCRVCEHEFETIITESGVFAPHEEYNCFKSVFGYDQYEPFAISSKIWFIKTLNKLKRENAKRLKRLMKINKMEK